MSEEQQEQQVKLAPMEVVTALKEAVKVQIAANYARLVVSTEDEEGNQLSDEVVQDELNELFAEQVEEFEATLTQTIQRMAKAKAEAEQQLSVVKNDLIVP